MNATNRSDLRWLLIAGYLGIIFVILACTVFGSGPQTSTDGPFRLEDGIIEAQDENGDWFPVAGDAALELVGELESLDPWTVAGITVETNESTLFEESLQAGDLVRVRGIILEDETWLAYSIELAEEQTDPILILIGIVDSVDPWTVNGVELNVTDATIITGNITPGMIVRVDILLLPDGTWEVLSIAPLGEATENAGCATIIATVVSVEGDQVQFLGWPTTVTLEEVTPTETVEANDNGEESEDDDEGEDKDEGGDEDENDDEESGGGQTFSSGDTVQVVICVSEDGAFVIVLITILDTDEEDGGESTGGEKVLVCHKPNNKKGGHTISIGAPAVPAHLAHGDTLGACP